MTCKDCIHYKVCCQKHLHVVTGMDFVYRYKYNHIERVCKDFKDRSQFVELPCKVGDLIYIIKKARGFSVRGAKVNSITITESGKIQVSCYRSSFTGFWGDDAFATKEEAEQALKEREANANDLPQSDNHS